MMGGSVSIAVAVGPGVWVGFGVGETVAVAVSSGVGHGVGVSITSVGRNAVGGSVGSGAKASSRMEHPASNVAASIRVVRASFRGIISIGVFHTPVPVQVFTSRNHTAFEYACQTEDWRRVQAKDVERLLFANKPWYSGAPSPLHPPFPGGGAGGGGTLDNAMLNLLNFSIFCLHSPPMGAGRR
jgi:hypothetical protein